MKKLIKNIILVSTIFVSVFYLSCGFCAITSKRAYPVFLINHNKGIITRACVSNPLSCVKMQHYRNYILAAPGDVITVYSRSIFSWKQWEHYYFEHTAQSFKRINRKWTITVSGKTIFDKKIKATPPNK